MKNNVGQIRIISGKWRSRKLKVLTKDDLRPTPDRVRETLFNWLQYDIAGSQCLDLFAGSGVLGFEAASRGSIHIDMVDDNKEVTDLMVANIAELGSSEVTVHKEDALKYLQSERNEHSGYDIVFIDPPYRAKLIESCCKTLDQEGLLSKNAKIYVEHHVDDKGLEFPVNWQCLKEKKAGQVCYQLFQREG